MQKLSLWMALTVASTGLVACGGSNEGDVRTVTVAPAGTSVTETAAPPPTSGDAILIEMRVPDAKLHAGEVLDVSVLGESPFCAGGTTTGGSEGPTITTTFHCPDGTLTVQYAPIQPSLVQGAVWEIVGGTGSFEGRRGGGSMVARFEAEDASTGAPSNGREIFTGTLDR